MANEHGKLTIDGTEYKIADLSDEAKVQINNIQATEAELKRLNIQTGIAQTARNSYLQALKAALPKN